MNPVEVNGIIKRYGDITALDEVSLRVEQGELFGLIGPDGAGKSSLYRILATLSAPDSGQAKICGLDTVSDYNRIRTKIGYMPEKFSLYQDLSVSENLHFFATVFGVKVEDNYDLIKSVFTQLEKFPNRKAGALSGGMKQKLALSCALIHRPEVLLLDEPTTGVDAVSRSEFWDMLASLQDHGITIMVSTSYMDEAALCDRVAMIDHGRILKTATPAELGAMATPNLYNAVSGDMFGLLSALRALPDVEDCYTFGATLHFVGQKDFKPEEALFRLAAVGIDDAKIYPAKGDIEDLFIKLTRKDD